MSTPLLTKIDSLLSQDPNFVLHLTAFVSEWEAKQEPPQQGEGLTAGLTPSQIAAFNAMVDFIHSDDRFFRLEGYAGTGKSFTVVRFLSYLLAQKLTFCVAAPTNKAVRNIANMVGSTANRISFSGLFSEIDVMTIARLLGQLPELNLESGKEEFITKLEVNVSRYDVILIDEFSMIDEKTFNSLLEQELNKVIFIGDPAQLPPINEKVTKVMTDPRIKTGATLQEIVRYEGDIAKVAEAIRINDRYKSHIFRFTTTPDQSIIVLDKATWLDSAATIFDSVEWMDNPDYCRIIAWKNESVNNFNKAMRRMIYGEVPEFIKSELLIAKSPLFRFIETGKSERKAKVTYANNREEFTVIDTALANEGDLTYWVLKVLDSQELTKELNVLTFDSLAKHNKRLDSIKKEANELTKQIKLEKNEKEKQQMDTLRRQRWGYYFSLKERWDDVTYAMALTAHSAQGSSLDHVFLFASEMGRCNERQQILYTSLTRTKTRCYVCQ